MALRFRIADRCLRSVDDTPGVVGASVGPDGPSITVDARYEPSELATTLGATLRAAGRAGTVSERSMHDGPCLPDHVTPIGLADAIAACEGTDEVRGLFGIAASLLPDVVDLCARAMAYEGIRDCAGWLVDVRDAIVARLEEEVGT